MIDAPALSAEMLRRLLRPEAITIVGASPNGHITEHLVRNLRNPSCYFAGPIHLVNPGYSKLFDLACHPKTADIPGPPGLVYLLVPGAACMPALASLTALPAGVILFPDSSHDPNGYETQVAAWGRGNNVAVLGPQSNGLVSPAGSVNGLLIPVIDRVVTGGVSLLAQSGGVLGGLVKFFAQRNVGLHSALEYGTACMLGPWDLGTQLAAEPDVRVIAIYADGIDSLGEFSAFLEAAEMGGKRVVMMIAGASKAARHAIASHSGMAATPRRILEGLSAQHGAVLVEDLDELGWAVEVIVAAGEQTPPGARVALFSDSGGGGIAIAEAVEAAGVGLEPPEGDVRERLEKRFGTALNPFDFGSASMGMAREQGADIEAVAADPGYGTFAFASTIGLASSERSVHVRQLAQFVAKVRSLGRVPFIASPLPFAEREPEGSSRVLYGNGSKESAVKLRTLAAIGGVAAVDRPAAGGAVESMPATTGAAAQALLAGLPISWPREVTVRSVSEIEPAQLQYPVVVKTEAGLAHRARVGGVLPGLTKPADVQNAVAFLLGRFGGAVSISEYVDHDEEYFLGAQRIEGEVFVLLGRGGAEAESAGLRRAPMRPDQAERFALERTPRHAAAVIPLLNAFQEWLLQSPDVQAVDLNPIVPLPSGFMALDAKIHLA